MIPRFGRSGQLPRGVHRASCREVCERFGYNQRREKLLNRLRPLLVTLRDAGVREVFLGGSFVTRKEYPRDIDALWEVGPDVDMTRLPRLFFEADGLAGEADVAGIHLFAEHPALGCVREWLTEGGRKGIIAVDLHTLEDEG